MTKNARYTPLPNASVAQWIGHADIDWSLWESRIEREIGIDEFRFTEKDKYRLSEAIRVMERNGESRIKLEEAKRIARRVRAQLTDMKLPDHCILNPKEPTQLSELLLRLLPRKFAQVFEAAMLHTLDDGQAGKTVDQRLASYLKLLRIGECTIQTPRPEAMAAHEIKQVFDHRGVPTKVTHTWPTAAGDDPGALSAFEDFVFEFVMPEYGSDSSAREMLKRRLEEAESALNT